MSQFAVYFTGLRNYYAFKGKLKNKTVRNK